MTNDVPAITVPISKTPNVPVTRRLAERVRSADPVVVPVRGPLGRASGDVADDLPPVRRQWPRRVTSGPRP